MDLYTLLQQVSTYQGWPMTQSQDGIRYEIPTEYGRTQIVEVTQGGDPDGRPMAFIWSPVCETSHVSDPWYLLGLNAELAYGALALQNNMIIIMETQLIESADAEELMRAVFYVAKYADQLEQQIYGNVDRS